MSETVRTKADHSSVENTSIRNNEGTVKQPTSTSTPLQQRANPIPVYLPETRFPPSRPPPPDSAATPPYLAPSGFINPFQTQSTSPPLLYAPGSLANSAPHPDAHINPTFLNPRARAYIASMSQQSGAGPPHINPAFFGPKPQRAQPNIVYTTFEEFQRKHPMTGRKKGEPVPAPTLPQASAQKVDNGNHNIKEGGSSQPQLEANAHGSSRKPGFRKAVFLPVNDDNGDDPKTPLSTNHSSRERSRSPIRDAPPGKTRRSPMRDRDSFRNDSAAARLQKTDSASQSGSETALPHRPRSSVGGPGLRGESRYIPWSQRSGISSFVNEVAVASRERRPKASDYF